MYLMLPLDKYLLKKFLSLGLDTRSGRWRREDITDWYKEEYDSWQEEIHFCENNTNGNKKAF